MSYAILITGRAGSGKTEVARIIKHHLNVEIIPMAENLKEIATFEFDWDGRKDERGRRLLQEIGSVGRAYQEDMWVDRVVARWKEISGLHAGMVSDDVRYQNEIDVVRREFDYVFVVQVTRPGSEGLYGLSEEALGHSSEAHWADLQPDFMVRNDGDLDQLECRVEVVINAIVKEVLCG